MKPEYCGVPDDAIDGNGAVVVPNKLNVYFLARQLFATKLALFPRREVQFERVSSSLPTPLML